MQFSQRYGHRPVRDIIQTESMDMELRIGLWNVLDATYWSQLDQRHYPEYNPLMVQFCRALWHAYFRRPFDTLPYTWGDTSTQIRDHFFRCEWFEVYDFLEAVVRLHPADHSNREFQRLCNLVLEANLAGYRFVDGKATPITSSEELIAVEKALQTGGKLKPVSLHLKQAVSLLSDRKAPDYRNSIKESISAIEAICKLMTGMNDATLSPAIKALEPKVSMHKDLKEAFQKLYWFTSDAHGIRHALMDHPDLGAEDALFMLVSCSAFVNYLTAKASKAGLKF